jgi:hydroxyacylglutathione hydrolase
MLVFLLSQYTQKNLEFALTVDPKNEVLVKKMTWVQQQRKDKKATVPSTIGDELEFNPFMRVDKESLQVTGFSQYFPAELLWSSLSLEKN